jgi:hypothetical protein
VVGIDVLVNTIGSFHVAWVYVKPANAGVHATVVVVSVVVVSVVVVSVVVVVVSVVDDVVVVTVTTGTMMTFARAVEVKEMSCPPVKTAISGVRRLK